MASDLEIVTLRRATADHLRAELSPVDVQEFMHASMTAEHLAEALKNRSLAVRVAFVGASKAELNSDEVDATLVWAVYVASKDVANQERRDFLTLRLLPQLVRLIMQCAWADTPADDPNDVTVKEPERLSCRELYTGESDTKSAMLWVIDWHQQVTLKPPAPDDLRDLLTLITRYDLHPKDGVIEAVDEIDMRHEDP